MKKYLMSGVAAIAFLAAFTSCSKSTDLYDEGAVQQKEIQKTENSYSDNFIKKYGQPAANHKWGFNSTAFTRSVYSDVNNIGNPYAGWKMNVYAPKNVNDESVNANEAKLVVAKFSEYRPEAVNQLNINFTDFWVHQVYKGSSKDLNGNYYKAHNNGDVTDASSKMNHLQCFKDCKFADLTDQTDNQGKRTVGNGFMEHINNFNSGDNTNNVTVSNQSETSPFASIIGASLMVNSGTQDFAYHNSEDSKYHNEYIIIAGADIDPSLAGYYYVGFDFCANGAGPNQQIDRDWVFNDWIVRISPAEYKNTARVACEDLGTTDDFDFNDVVFDVANSNDNGSAYTIITLRAAGGTLPLYIEANGVSKEVHELFGVSTGTMVNTNNGTTSCPIVQFTIPGTVTPKQVTVRVAENAKEVVLKAEEGQAPQKICVKTSFQWCDERQQIGDKYKDFPAWVQNEQVEWY